MQTSCEQQQEISLVFSEELREALVSGRTNALEIVL